MIIAISGTPGTGKTSVCKELCDKYDFTYVDGKQLVQGDVCSEYDEERDCEVVDVEKWCEAVENLVNKKGLKNAVIDSHFSHDLSPDFVDVCIIVTCEDKVELQRRLAARGYSKAKVEENLEAEIMDVCAEEAEENGHTVIRLDTSTDRWKKELAKIMSDVA